MPFNYTCDRCSKSFQRTTEMCGAHTFCSSACYHAFTKKARGVACPVCGKVTIRPPSAIKAGRRYCSRACFLKDTAAKTVDKVCPVCAKTFTVNANTADRFNHCSIKCRHSGVITRHCARCGAAFQSSTRGPKRNSKYCSEVCYRPPVYINCRNCGERFRKLPGAANRQFCCFACYRAHQGETLLEKAMRNALESAGVEFIQEAKIGRYSVDFLVPSARVAIEVDGEYWHQDQKKDAKRDRYLAKKGWSTIRFTETYMKNVDDLSAAVSKALEGVSPL